MLGSSSGRQTRATAVLLLRLLCCTLLAFDEGDDDKVVIFQRLRASVIKRKFNDETYAACAPKTSEISLGYTQNGWIGLLMAAEQLMVGAAEEVL